MQRISITNPQNIIDGTAKKYYFKLRNTGGPKGDKGEKGDTGATGPQGPQGDPCTVVVNSTATLEPGSNAYVTNTGSLSNAVLNFGIPKGDRGPQGAKGDKGDTGAQGETGPRGPQGPAGQNATVYVGTTTTGAPGTQASVYNSGTDRNAVLNFTIPQGAKGDTGATGPQGPAGQDGQNFTPTVVDSLPATGDQSKLYLTPKNYTTGTATGNPITISLGEDAGQITSAQLDGDTYQKTYTGKNLLNESTSTDNWVNPDGELSPNNLWRSSQLIKVTPGSTFTISGEQTGDGFVQFLWAGYDASQGFITGQRQQINQTNNVTFTVGASSEYIRVGYRKDALKNIQLELGSTATSWEPYVGGVPSPNPDYPQQIQTVTGTQTVEVVGKNLLGYNEPSSTRGLTLSYNQSTGVISASGTTTANWAWLDDFTPIKPLPAGTYTFSTNKTRNYNIALRLYTDSTTYSSANILSGSKEATKTVSSDIVRVAVLLDCGSGYVMNDTFELQMESGELASSFAPYSKQTLPISLGSIELCKIGDYQDYIYKDGSDWKVRRAIGSYTIDGSEDWYASSSAIKAVFQDLPDQSHAGIGISNIYKNYGRDNLNGSTIMECAVRTTVGNLLSGSSFGFGIRTDGGSGDLTNAANAIYVRFDGYSTSSAVKGYFSSNNAVLLYWLDTPTDTTITDTNLIAQLETIRTASLQASNTITNTATGSNLAGDMELGYCEYDPQNRYDKWLWLDLNNNYEKLGS